MKVPSKKYIPRKRKAYPKKTVPKTVKKYVKNILHKGVENKYHLAFASNQSLSPPFILSLVPAINQGNQHSQRVGNTVRIMSSRVEFIVNNSPYNVTSNPYGGPCMYRWFVITQRKDNSTTFNSGGFFEINNSSTNIQNNHLDQILKPNDSQYKVHRQGTFTLGTTSTSTTFPAANSVFDNSKTVIHKKIYFNKYIAKTIRYDDGGTTPTNTNCWLVILPTYANGSSVSGYTPGNISTTIHHSYEDS